MFSLDSPELGNEETESSGHCSETGSTSSWPHIVHVRGFPTKTRAQEIIKVSSSGRMHQVQL